MSAAGTVRTRAPGSCRAPRAPWFRQPPHGYNVGYADALRRAAQIAFDLDFDGVLITFSWSSKAEITKYFSDEASADFAVDPLINRYAWRAHTRHEGPFRRPLHGQPRAAAGAGADRRAARTKHTFGEAILAHADVDAKRCAQLFKNVKGTAAGMTLCVNSNDWALRISEILRGRVRCGRVAAVYEGVDTLDSTGMEKGEGVLARWSSGWNHNVFVRNPLLFGEITRLMLTSQSPPDQRTPETEPVKNGAEKTYLKYHSAADVATK